MADCLRPMGSDGVYTPKAVVNEDRVTDPHVGLPDFGLVGIEQDVDLSSFLQNFFPQKTSEAPKIVPLLSQSYQPTGNAFFDKQVDDLAQRLPVRITSKAIDTENVERPQWSAPAGDDAKHIIARQILKIYGNRPDLVNTVVSQPGFTIFISTANNSPTRGLSVQPNPNSGKDIYMILDNQGVAKGLSDPDDGRETIAHEFTHLVDYSNVSGIETSPDYKDAFLEMQHKFQQIAPTLPQDDPTLSDEDSVYPGIRNYAFFNGEFMSATMEVYLENPQALNNASPELYQVYDEKLNPGVEAVKKKILNPTSRKSLLD